MILSAKPAFDICRAIIVAAAALVCTPGQAIASLGLIGDQIAVQLKSPLQSAGVGFVVGDFGIEIGRPEGVFGFRFTDTTVAISFYPENVSNPAELEAGLELEIYGIDHPLVGVSLDQALLNAGLTQAELNFDARSLRLALGGTTLYADQPYVLTLDFEVPATVAEPAPLALIVLALGCAGLGRRLALKPKTLKTWVAAAATVATAGAAQAALIDRGGGMVYDTTRNITWLADMNHAVTSGYAAANAGGIGSNQILADGRMGWDAAVAWADQLVFGGFSDWRLPTQNASDTTCSNSFAGGSFPDQHFGTGCTGGELSGLFVTDLGNKAYQSVTNPEGDTAEQIANLALFSNVQLYFFAYWSGTASAPNPHDSLGFNPSIGYQEFFHQSRALHVLAVRNGDVAAPVPEPQTLALALLALGATGVARRRR